MSALARDKEFTKEARRLKRLESKVNNIKYQILESPDLAGEHLQMLLGEIKHKSESSGQNFFVFLRSMVKIFFVFLRSLLQTTLQTEGPTLQQFWEMMGKSLA